MSHDKLVNYVDTQLKDVPDEVREELLSLHYKSICDAKATGFRDGVMQQKDIEEARMAREANIPLPPEFPPNQIIADPSFPAPLVWLVMLSAVAAVVLSAVAIMGSQ